MKARTKPPQIEWNERAPAESNARRQLPSLVTAYFAEARELLAKNPSPRQLHRLRLATKRLRYTLELFRTCYGPGLETRIGELRHLQEKLGEVNDSVAAERLLSAAMKASPRRARVKKFLRERSTRQARDFRKHWTEVFDAPGRERWWTTYLAREATVSPRGVPQRAVPSRS